MHLPCFYSFQCKRHGTVDHLGRFGLERKTRGIDGCPPWNDDSESRPLKIGLKAPEGKPEVQPTIHFRCFFWVQGGIFLCSEFISTKCICIFVGTPHVFFLSFSLLSHAPKEENTAETKLALPSKAWSNIPNMILQITKNPSLWDDLTSVNTLHIQPTPPKKLSSSSPILKN